MDMSALQGMTSSGMILPTPQPMPQSLTSGMGPWSQLAYQMAGSPKQGGLYPSVAPPTALPGSYPASGGSGVGGLLTGLLGSAARNPSVINQIGGLLGGGLPATAAGEAASGVASAGAANAVAPLTTAQLGLAPSGALTDSSLTSLYGGAGLGGGGSGGLLGGATAYGTDAGIAPTGGLLGTTDAAGSAAGGAGSAGSLGAAGAAIPIAAALIPFLLGASGDKADAQKAALGKAWLAASGSTDKVVNPPTQQQAGALAQGGFAGLGSGYQAKSVVYDKNGNPMSGDAAMLAMLQYAQATGMPTGNISYTPAQLQQLIASGGPGSQVYGG